VDLVVLDPADREGEVDLQRAELRIDLVRAGEVDAVELAEDLVALVDVALIQLVVGLDRLAGDAVELEQRGLQLARRDLLVVVRKRHGSPSRLSRTARSISSRERRSEGEEMAYELPPLPYDYNALEPTIDEQTMRIHHGKHHQAYVDNVNKALDGTEWADKPIEQVLAVLDVIPEEKRAAVRNNGGGHANHSLFWTIMKPGGGGDPSGALADAINETFGSVGDLKSELNDAGVKRFGSGWTWLIWDGTGLAVVST